MLNKEIIIITGAGQGIGKEISKNIDSKLLWIPVTMGPDK